MSDSDDEVEEAQATRLQHILDKLALSEKAVNKLNDDIKIVMLISIRKMLMFITSTTKKLGLRGKRH